MKTTTRDAVVMAVIVIVLVGSGLVSAGMALVDNDTFLPGSSINGVDISGLTPEQAEIMVLEIERAKMEPTNKKVVCAGKTLLLDDSAVGRTCNAETLIHDYLYNIHDGTTGEKYDTLLAFRKNVIVEYAYEYDIEKIRHSLEVFARQFEVLAKDASIQINDSDLEYVPEQTGVYLDAAEAAALVYEQLNAGNMDSMELELKTLEPSVTVEQLQQDAKPIGSCTTTIGDDGQYADIDLICEAVSGSVVQPDEVLSLNALTGPRDAQSGYTRTSADRADTGEYAGVSQLAGTLYVAALNADMEIVERNRQSVASGYLEPGLDAIIDTTTNKDLILKNVSDMPAYIFASREGNKLDVAIYGKLPRPDYSVKIETEVLEWIPPGEPVYEYDENLSGDAKILDVEEREGVNVIVSRCYYKDDGQTQVDKKRISTDNYQPVKAVYRVGDISLVSK